MNMKRKVFALAIIAICAAVTAAGTWAYFTDSAHAHNVITSGGIDIEIVESKIDENGEKVDFENNIKGIMPGQSVSKIVEVKNHEDSGDAWIRVFVQMGISEPGDPITNPLIKNLPLEIEVNGEMIPVVTYQVNEEHWVYDEDDGYYHYKQPVASGEQTEPLFEEVEFAPEMGNEYQNCTVRIDITAEAVQAVHNGETWDEVVSWTENGEQ